MRMCRRFEEAAAALEEAIEVQRVTKIQPQGMNTHTNLAQAYVEIGQFEWAVEASREGGAAARIKRQG